MMYDFHYPLGRGKLNEDTVNCRAEQFGMMGENASPGYFFQFLSLLCWGVEKWCRCEAMIPPPLLPTSLPAGVHRLSINQGLLTAETTLSHQHAISRLTDSALTTLHSRYKYPRSQLCFLSSLTLTVHLWHTS